MDKIILLFCLLLIGMSCANRKGKADVTKEAAKVEATTNPRLQYSRAVSLVEANPDLSEEQKDKLVKLIETYADKMYVNKEKLSQYRQVLLNEMLETEGRNNSKIAAAKKDMTNLNKQSSEYLESFVTEFKSIVGTSAKNHQPEIMDVIMVE